MEQVELLKLPTHTFKLVYCTLHNNSEYTTMCVYVSCWLTLLFLLHQDGKTALDLAKQENKHDVVTYLEEIGEYTY